MTLSRVERKPLTFGAAEFGGTNKMRFDVALFPANLAGNVLPCSLAWDRQCIRRFWMFDGVAGCAKDFNVALNSGKFRIFGVLESMVPMKVIGGTAAFAFADTRHCVTDRLSRRIWSVSDPALPIRMILAFWRRCFCGASDGTIFHLPSAASTARELGSAHFASAVKRCFASSWLDALGTFSRAAMRRVSNVGVGSAEFIPASFACQYGGAAAGNLSEGSGHG
jgi:hypothetical protein